jgi:hypothetical protein
MDTREECKHIIHSKVFIPPTPSLPPSNHFTWTRRTYDDDDDGNPPIPSSSSATADDDPPAAPSRGVVSRERTRRICLPHAQHRPSAPNLAAGQRRQLRCAGPGNRWDGVDGPASCTADPLGSKQASVLHPSDMASFRRRRRCSPERWTCADTMMTDMISQLVRFLVLTFVSAIIVQIRDSLCVGVKEARKSFWPSWHSRGGCGVGGLTVVVTEICIVVIAHEYVRVPRSCPLSEVCVCVCLPIGRSVGLPVLGRCPAFITVLSWKEARNRVSSSSIIPSSRSILGVFIYFAVGTGRSVVRSAWQPMRGRIDRSAQSSSALQSASLGAPTLPRWQRERRLLQIFISDQAAVQEIRRQLRSSSHRREEKKRESGPHGGSLTYSIHTNCPQSL